MVFSLPLQRNEKISVRSSFASIAHRYLLCQAEKEGKKLLLNAEKRRFFEVQWPVLVDMVMSVQYLQNHILDRKNKVNGSDWNKVQDTLQASHMLKSVIFQYISQKVFPNDQQLQAQISASVWKMFHATDVGQLHEKKWGNYATFLDASFKLPPLGDAVKQLVDSEFIDGCWEWMQQAGIDKSREPFFRAYLQRIYLANSSLFIIMVQVIMALMGYEGERQKALVKFAGSFGVIAQLVNDIADYLPRSMVEQGTSTKLPSDAFADLRGDNVTLPFLFWAPEISLTGFTELRNSLSTDEGQRICFNNVRQICRNKAIVFVREMGKVSRNYLGVKQLHNEILMEFVDIIYNRRYFKYFFDSYEDETTQSERKSI